MRGTGASLLAATWASCVGGAGFERWTEATTTLGFARRARTPSRAKWTGAIV